MLTDIALKKLKPREKPYKVTDRDGMYVTVFPAGTITFRFDYRISNRRETLTLGRYGPDGLTLSTAREKCIAARNASPKAIRRHASSSARSVSWPPPDPGSSPKSG